MECLIHLMSLCVFDPSNVYLTAGIDSQIHDGDHLRYAQQCYGTAWCARGKPPGPVGTFKLGVTVEVVRGLVLEYGLEHRSFLNYSKDGGQEFAFAEITWHPLQRD